MFNCFGWWCWRILFLLVHESTQWELFCRNLFLPLIEVFWLVQPQLRKKRMLRWKWRHAGKIRCSLKMSFRLVHWGVLDFNLEDKLRVPFQSLPISWDTEVFRCCISLLPWKVAVFFFIFNELTGRYLQWPGKSRCSIG